MAHHYATQLWHSETHKHRERIMDDMKRHHGSVFRGISIVEARRADPRHALTTRTPRARPSRCPPR